jgi:isoamylase
VIKGKTWCMALDTSQPSPQDIIAPQDQKPFGKNLYSVNSKAVVVFENIGF